MGTDPWDLHAALRPLKRSFTGQGLWDSRSEARERSIQYCMRFLGRLLHGWERSRMPGEAPEVTEDTSTRSPIWSFTDVFTAVSKAALPVGLAN